MRGRRADNEAIHAANGPDRLWRDRRISDGKEGAVGLAVQSQELSDDASAFDRLAAIIDEVVAKLHAPAMSGDALAGAELGPANAAFEDLWQRCSRDLTVLAESIQHLSATVRNAADVYRQTDDAVASAARRYAGGL